METKFEEIGETDNHKASMDFLSDDTIVSIIKHSFDKDLPDKYNEWKLFSDYELLEKIVKALYEPMSKKWDDYDYLGSLGSSGAPLTYLLSSTYRKNAFLINDDWGVSGLFQPIKPPDIDLKNKKVLLVDSVFESGLTACNGINILEKHAGGRDKIGVDVLVITFFPEYTDRTFVKRYKGCTLYYLYYWDKEVRNEARKIKELSNEI
jgi:orotate phosphoribosyltransferase